MPPFGPRLNNKRPYMPINLYPHETPVIPHGLDGYSSLRTALP